MKWKKRRAALLTRGRTQQGSTLVLREDGPRRLIAGVLGALMTAGLLFRADLPAAPGTAGWLFYLLVLLVLVARSGLGKTVTVLRYASPDASAAVRVASSITFLGWNLTSKELYHGGVGAIAVEPGGGRNSATAVLLVGPGSSAIVEYASGMRAALRRASRLAAFLEVSIEQSSPDNPRH